MQLDLRNSAQFAAEHVIAVHIIKDWKLCNDPEEHVLCLLDNRGRSDFAQLKDIDVKRGTDIGETILSLFLGIPNSRITSIICLKPCTEKNSSYAQAAKTAAEFKDRRLTRRLSSQNSSLTTSSTSSQTSTRRRRGNQRAKSRKSKSNTIERMKKLYKHTLPSKLHLQPRCAITSDLPWRPVHEEIPVRSLNTRSGRKGTFFGFNLF